MCSRISSAILLAAALAACSGKSGSSDASGPADEGKLVSVPCALGGAKDFSSQCQLEQLDQGGKPVVILRHPDGGFRRLLVLESGKRYAAADGADAVASEPNGKDIEVSVGGDTYLIPAPAVPDAAKP
jgi:hypothetical protein